MHLSEDRPLPPVSSHALASECSALVFCSPHPARVQLGCATTNVHAIRIWKRFHPRLTSRCFRRSSGERSFDVCKNHEKAPRASDAHLVLKERHARGFAPRVRSGP